MSDQEQSLENELLVDDAEAELRLFLQSLMLPNNHYSAVMIMGTRMTVPCGGSQ